MGSTATELLSENIWEPSSQQLVFPNDAFQRAVNAHRHDVALVACYQPPLLYGYKSVVVPGQDTECLRWTYEVLQQAVLKLAESLSSRGLEKGMPVAMFLYNGVEYLTTLLACLHLGCQIVLVNPRNIANEEEVAYILNSTNVRAVFASSTEVARAIDQIISPEPGLLLRAVVDTTGYNSHWQAFTELLCNDEVERARSSRHTFEPTDPTVMFFTSGTTSMPKGCPHTQSSLSSFTTMFSSGINSEGRLVSCIFLPGNHGFGLVLALATIYKMGSIVYTGPVVDPVAIVKAVQQERCTWMGLVPTILHALVEAKASLKQPPFEHLTEVLLSGTTISREVVNIARYELGCKTILSAYGMSEGCPVISPRGSDPESLIRNGLVIAGYVYAGCRIRIIKPGESDPVPRGERGEIHQAGPQLILGYLGGRGTEDFYTDANGIRWFKSGDQAIMDIDGAVTITGRYKEIIIRGGENISSAAVESVLGQIDGVQVVVVGQPDHFAGEVPVAIYKSKQKIPGKVFQDLALEKLGTMYVPDECISLSDLGLSDFPVTMTGKIRKTELAGLVQEYRKAKEQELAHEEKMVLDRHAQETSNQDLSSSKDTILLILSRLLGLAKEDIQLEIPLAHFADSISLMRFRGSLKKLTGTSISAEEITPTTTLVDVIQIFDEKKFQPKVAEKIWLPARAAAPTATDMVHTLGDVARAEKTRAQVCNVIEPLGLSWEHDVEDVIPVYDFFELFFQQIRPTSSSIRVPIVTKSTDLEEVKFAVEAALAKHSVLRSILIKENQGTEDEQWLYAVMKPTAPFLKQCITMEESAVKNRKELSEVGDNDPSFDVSHPGPFVRMKLYALEDERTVGIVLNMHHVTFDALSVMLFLKDIDAALKSNGQGLPSHIPFKIWGDSHFSLRNSLEAQKSIKFHVDRLWNLKDHSKAQFPRQRAPQWLTGTRRGWSPSADELSNKAFSNATGQSLNPPSRSAHRADGQGLTTTLSLPSIMAVRLAVPNLAISVIVKAAQALVNVFHTSHTHALFFNNQACRDTLPFLPAALAPHFDINVLDVDGPTWTQVINLIAIDRSETLLEFLTRLQADQDLLTTHAHAPLKQIIRALPTESAALIMDSMRRQCYAWTPGKGAGPLSPYENMDAILGSGPACHDIGISFNAGSGGKDGTEFEMSVIWDDANVYYEEADQWLADWVRALQWIVEGGGLERQVGGFVEALNGGRKEGGYVWVE